MAGEYQVNVGGHLGQKANARAVVPPANWQKTVEVAQPSSPVSTIVQKINEFYERLFGTKAELKSIHAGLECGLLIEKIPDMDVASIGPQIENAHSPEEKVQISSVQRFYRHLTALLESLA